MTSITACILTKNSSDTLEECLRSIRPAVDEIVIVDGYSKDKTIPMSKKYGAKVYRHRWSGSYARERNLCLSKAKGEWILVIDSDERLSKPLQHFIQSREFLRYVKEEDYSGFAFSRINYVSSKGKKKALKHGFFYPDWQIRLFRKGTFYRGDIHERPTVEKVKYVDYPIIHTPRESVADFRTLKNKYRNYAKMESKMLFKDKPKAPLIGNALTALYGPIYSSILLAYALIYKAGILDGIDGLKANMIYAEAKLLPYLYAAL